MKVAINTDRFVYPLTWDLVHWEENTQHCKNITPKNPHIYILLWNRKTITKHFPHPLICRDCFGRVPFCFITSETNSPHDLHQFDQIESCNHCPQPRGASTFSGNMKFTIHLQFYLPKMYLKLIFPLQPTSPIHNQGKMKQWVNVLPWKPRNLMLHNIIITENSNSPNPNKLPRTCSSRFICLQNHPLQLLCLPQLHHPPPLTINHEYKQLMAVTIPPKITLINLGKKLFLCWINI